MTDSVFTLKYVRAKNGFLYLPENYVRKMEGLGYLTPSSVLKLQRCEKKQPSTAYFSWRAFKVEGNSIGLSATYATKLGLRENECIVLHNIGDVPSVRHVQVTAVTEDDVEIVAQNAASLQLSLLDQVRVVWVGQLLTLWLSDAFSVTLRVDSLEPSTSVGKLEVLTEIEIDSPSAADQNLQTTVDNSQSSSSLKSDGTISSPVSPSLQDTSTKSSGWLSSVRSFFTGSIEIKADERTDKNEEENLPSHPNSIKCSRRSHGVFRIHPIEGILNHSNSCEVFLLERDIVNIFCGDTSEQMLHMIKIKSPKEMSVSRTPQTKTNGSDSITQLEVSSDKSVVVRVRSMEHQPQQNKFVHGTKRVFLPYNLRRTLGLDIGSRVELISCQSEDKTANPTRIVLTVHSKKNVNGSTMVRSFEHCVHSHGGGLLLCDGFLLTLSNESGSFDVRVQLFPKTVQSVVISKEQLSQTEVLARMAGPGSVELPNILHENISLKDNLYLRHLETLMDDALISLELTLGLNEPLIKDGKSSFARDNILLTGKKGSGKTSVAVAVCHTLKGPPHYVHSVTFKCRPLRGKKVETLLKLLLAHVAECVYYQPSVLILDDLECVASKAQEQDKDYFNRVGKMLLNLLQDVQSQHCVAFIGTAVSSANLCAPLVSARGTHFFNTFLELPELNKAERQGIIEKLFSQRQASSQLNNFPSETVITDCASRTDGYTCQDLVDLIDKAVFEAWKRTGPSSKQPILQAFDVDTAILESTPMQLRGVQLHKDSAHCWDDIGGLTYVKEVLVEVLQWPVMYPELFLDFPLRPQSGLLLYGAPGTGKTLLAGAVAHECGLNFISVKGPELLSKYIGASEESVRKIFQKAQSAKPCVLFFDEFDSLAPRRGHDSTGVTDRVVNQLLTQLDGVESLVGVWVMAATSRPDLLDPALLRPGRLDRSILCPLPDEMDRLSILKALSRKMKLDSDVDLTCIAAQSEHFTGADLQAVLYTAQLAAVEECQNQCNNNQTEYEGFIVKQEHLLAALSGTRPSLTWHERKKYQRIYDRFARSGQGDFSDDMAGAAQRATLA